MILPVENRVLYILGAGFSAPLGLPVMGNFLSRSKDLFFKDRTRYAGFQKVYDTISQLSVIKNTFHADLHNIEEILSLLEMEAFMEGGRLKDEFVSFLSEVVRNLLPPIDPISGRPGSGNWHGLLFDGNPVWRPYFEMMACMLHAQVDNPDDRTARMILSSAPSSTRYAVVTLNYDTVIESTYDFLVKSFRVKDVIPLATKDYDPSWRSLQLAKLHGCAQAGTIVPPTWRKGSGDVVQAWKLAHHLLRDANQIRIVGYSLPVSDSYIRYLLKSAMGFSSDLKKVDIINNDRSRIEPRYRDFIDFNNLRFHDGDLQFFFRLMADRVGRNSRGLGFKDSMLFGGLEEVHENFFKALI